VKLCIFIAVCISLVFFSVNTSYNPQLEKLGSGEYQIYSTETVTSPLITKVINLGFSYIYHTDTNNAADLRKLFTYIDGESIILTDSNLTAEHVLLILNYHPISAWQNGELVSTYAYSIRSKNFITNDNKKINLQIAQNGNILTVGWPVILGSW